MSSILIKNVTLNREIKDVLVIDNLIDKISDNISFDADRVIDGTEKELIPGFVNMHTHAAMTLMRGLYEDYPLFEWLNKIWDIETRLDPEMIYWGTKLACLEMIKSGTTCFNDQYWIIDQSAKAVSEMGIRSTISYVFLDLGNREKALRQRDECIAAFELSKKWDPRLRFAVSVHAPFTVTEENILWASNFATKYDLPLHIHISETQQENIDSYKKYGVSPTKRLKSLGILNENVIGAHCVWVDEEDIDILGNKRVNVVHNVNSNLKLASGYKFPCVELSNAGANVTIGTDGCASSNNLDMLEAMKTTAVLQKAWRRDPSALPIEPLMNMATLNGAKALKINSGHIVEGALADLLLINVHSAAFIPNCNFEANLIYSANSSCVDTVICDGKIVMEGRKVKGEEEILENAYKAAYRLVYDKK